MKKQVKLGKMDMKSVAIGDVEKYVGIKRIACKRCGFFNVIKDFNVGQVYLCQQCGDNLPSG